MTPKNYSFIRVAPIPTWGMGKCRKGGKPGKNTGLAGHVAHDLRFLITENADPERMKDNIILIEKTGWKPVRASKENLEKLVIKDQNFLTELAKQKLEKKGIKAQKNHVKCAAFINSVSPEFLRDGSEYGEINSEKVKIWMRATVEYNRRKHGDNLLMICFHMDELNPHASVYALPVREKLIKKGGRPRKDAKEKPREHNKELRLDYWEMYTRDVCKYVIDKATNEKKLERIADGTCTQMQDEYNSALREAGLDVQRGMRKAHNEPGLSYQPIRKYYGKMKQAIEEVSRMTIDDLRDFVTAKTLLINQVDRLIDERNHYQIAGGAAQQKVADLENRIADSMLDIPVEDVIRAITGTDPTPTVEGHRGSNPSPYNKKPTSIQLEFRLPNGQRLGIDTARNRFKNLTPHIPFLGEGAKCRSASGSINAVMYLTGCSYDAATARLATLFGNDAAKRAAAKKIEKEAEQAKQRLVIPDESKWSVLLIKLRAWKIDEDAISCLLKHERIAANTEGQIVFRKQYLNENDVLDDTGDIVVDTVFPEVNLIETGEGGMFLALESRATHNVICATPIDALAIKSLPEHQNANVIAIGHLPNNHTIRSLQLFLNVFPDTTLYAENLLKAGIKISKWLAENFANQIKMIPLPEGFRHWLDYHRAQVKSIPEQKNAPIKSPRRSGLDEIVRE